MRFPNIFHFYFHFHFQDRKGYTLMELLIVTSIIMGLTIAAILFATRSIEQAKVAQALSQITEIKRAYSLYRTDTRSIPVWYHPLAANPLITDPGVSGWNGPYTDEQSLTVAHPWRGHVGWHGAGGDCGYGGAPASCPDRDGNGAVDFIIVLDDDLPQTGQNNNEGRIPQSALLTLDRELDDGDLATGRVQGNAEGDFGGILPTEVGELMIWVF